MNKNNSNKNKQKEVRFARIEDLPAITDIYNQAIRSGQSTADTHELSVQERLIWFRKHSENKFPIYVLETEEGVLAWASLSGYRAERPAFRYAAEISYYVDFSAFGRGYASTLYRHVEQDCKRLDIKYLLAFLLEINTPSVRFLEKNGYKKLGLLPQIVHLRDQQCGHLIYGKELKY